MPIVPPISWPVVFRPGEHAALLVGGAGHDRHRDGDEHDAQAEAGHEHAGQDVGEVAAAGAGAGEQQHAACGGGEAGRHRQPESGVLEHVLADMHAGGERDGERQEAQPGQQRAGAEHVLHVQRDQQEGAEQARRRPRAS